MSVLSTVSIVDALVQRLREQVLDGELSPNETVAETEVAANYGVSRPTAKGAIVTLVNSGLLRREANRPAYVPDLTAPDIFDIYRVRIPLEVEVARTLASQRASIPAAQAAVAELEGLPDETPTSQLIAADLRFHRALIAAVDSPRLSRHYNGILDEVHLAMKQYWRVLGQEKIAREHARILRAIQSGNVPRATKAMRDHLEGAARIFAEEIAQSA
ncbi:MAG: GntR family transcriptional regulator [Solirubrobacterales bacterium]|nr:GntR family transcriptional regulator [Solirubrobacterales bacterium]